MPDLFQKTALRAFEPQVDAFAGLEIRERPDISIAWLARRQGGDLTRIETLINASLPAPGHATLGFPMAAISIGRDQWLLTAPWNAAFSRQIKDLAGHQGSVADQSDGWATFQICGDRTEDLMEHLAPIDIRQMMPGMATPTPIEHLRCIVLRREREVTLMGPRNSAGSLHQALLGAARSVT